MVMGAVLVGVELFVGLVGSNGYEKCVGGSVNIGGAVVKKWLWELCWWECSYLWGWCEQMVMGAVLVGVSLLVGLVFIKWLWEMF